jgi:hypothetical protein
MKVEWLLFWTPSQHSYSNGTPSLNESSAKAILSTKWFTSSLDETLLLLLTKVLGNLFHNSTELSITTLLCFFILLLNPNLPRFLVFLIFFLSSEFVCLSDLLRVRWHWSSRSRRSSSLVSSAESEKSYRCAYESVSVLIISLILKARLIKSLQSGSSEISFIILIRCKNSLSSLSSLNGSIGIPLSIWWAKEMTALSTIMISSSFLPSRIRRSFMYRVDSSLTILMQLSLNNLCWISSPVGSRISRIQFA